MIKLGLVSAATYGPGYRDEDAPRTPGSFHGTAFASTYNGYDEAKVKQRFLEMVRTGKEPVPVEEEAEVIAVLEAGKRSLDEGREVAVAEVMG